MGRKRGVCVVGALQKVVGFLPDCVKDGVGDVLVGGCTRGDSWSWSWNCKWCVQGQDVFYSVNY